MTGVCCLRCYGSKEIVFDSNNLEYPGTPAYSSGSFLTTCRRVPCPLCCPPKEIPMAGGLASSSVCPPYHLVPTVGMKMLAERFQAGVDRKGDKAWNAVSSNQACLKDKAFVIERISHIIDHAMKLRDKLQADDVAAMKEDDDAGAITWAGIFLCCVVDQLLKDANSVVHEGNIGQ